MKKKNLKNLMLNKKSISNIQSANSIVGGVSEDTIRLLSLGGFTCNSDRGCTGTPDQTMTCADWSCSCNNK